MDPRTVLVPASADPASLSTIRAARAVAEMFDAGLTGVGARRLDDLVEAAIPYLDDQAFARLRQEIEADLAQAEAGFRAALADCRVRVDWRATTAPPLEAVLRAAAGADLIVADRDGAALGADPGALVLAAGTPMLLAPPQATAFEGRAVLVGWKNTREARRAVGDALPFLKRATSVLLAAVEENPKDPEDGLDEALARLSRHGIGARTERLAQAPGGAGEALLSLADRDGVDLIVAGAYGHSRLQEWVFGGVTRTLLQRARTFVLFSR